MRKEGLSDFEDGKVTKELQTVEVGRWVVGMSRGSVLMAGGGLSSKNRNFLHTVSYKKQPKQNTTKTHKRVYMCVSACV